MTTASPGAIDDILAIRERWHTKKHPFFPAFAEGKLPLRAMGVYKAMHWHFVQRAIASFGVLFAQHVRGLRGRAQDDRREHLRGGRPQGDPTRGPAAPRSQRADFRSRSPHSASRRSWRSG